MNNSSRDESEHGAVLKIEETPRPHATLLARGAVSLPDVRDALRALELARAARPALDVLVIDAIDVTRFGRGAVVEIARWIPRHGTRLEHVILVSSSNQLRTSVQALAACAPHVKVFCTESRESALTLLDSERLSLTG